MSTQRTFSMCRYVLRAHGSDLGRDRALAPSLCGPLRRAPRVPLLNKSSSTWQENGILTCNPRAKSWFYGDELSPAEQEKHFRSLHTNPIAPFLEPVRSAAWKQIPSTYVYSTVDRPMPFPMMKYMVQQARDTVVAAAEEQGEFAAEQLENVFGGELGEFHVDAPHCAIFLAPERVQEVGEILVTVAEGSR